MIVSNANGNVKLNIFHDVTSVVHWEFDHTTSIEFECTVRNHNHADKFNKSGAIKAIRDYTKMKNLEYQLFSIKAGMEYAEAESLANMKYPDVGISVWKAIVEAIHDKITK